MMAVCPVHKSIIESQCISLPCNGELEVRFLIHKNIILKDFLTKYKWLHHSKWSKIKYTKFISFYNVFKNNILL